MPIKIAAICRHISYWRMKIFRYDRGTGSIEDIRPLKILILNLMPTKIETETQILRLLSNSPIQVEAELLQTATHEVKNVSKEHMLKFYKTFDDIKNERFDGMVVTGAPVENMEFEQVDYWDELCRIFEWSKTNVYSSSSYAGALRRRSIINTV